MQKLKYFFEFIIITILFLIFKIVGLKTSSYIGGKLGSIFGPIFRSKKIIESNIGNALPEISNDKKNELIKKMWNNYGRILSEYMFMKKFRKNKNNSNLLVEGQEILDQIKKEKKPVIFVSGHFNNFELMAMHIDKSGIDLSAIYRPLNNDFLNIFMENIRKKYICRKQIKKGLRGVRDLLTLFRNNYSIALMIDQRVSEGIKCEFFGKQAYTTTIPAQFFKKFKCNIVPIYIERINGVNFKMKVFKSMQFNDDDSIETITKELNSWLEKMILKKPEQWIWSHNRWK